LARVFPYVKAYNVSLNCDREQAYTVMKIHVVLSYNCTSDVVQYMWRN